MNLLLIKPEELQDENRAIIRCDTLARLRNSQYKLDKGRQLKAGVRNGLMGTAEIIENNGDFIELELELNQPPPAALPLTLACAIPRPKMLRRILINCAELGIKQIHLVNCWKTDKSFLQSDVLNEKKIEQQLVTGLEQACDTVMPVVEVHARFKPFAEDLLPDISRNKEKLLAHPAATAEPGKSQGTREYCAFIGPEGGFSDYEVSLLENQGFKPISFGPRILKVENAVALLAAWCSLP